MSGTDIIFRVVIAFLLGGMIGLERQWRHRTAGLRTNTLVSLGAALYVILSINITGDTSPSRIASQIVSGIGFLGAGVIMKEGFTVRGLNTAATLWCSAAIGSLSGMGYWQEALLGASAVVIAHLTLRPVANFLNRRPIKAKSSLNTYIFKVICTKSKENHFRVMILNALSESSFVLKSIKSNVNRVENLTEILAELSVIGQNEQTLERIVDAISKEEELISVGWEVIDRNDD
ncbi:MAG: MgtC/SapB family protein [Bacteroidales bacterium]|nr:MgtC/SapB family protein [Bacteroidales bacterium]